MVIKFASPKTPAAYKVKAKPVTTEYLDGPGTLRVQNLMYLYQCSQSAVYRKITTGELPPPTGHNPRAFWSNAVIRQHLETGVVPSSA